MPKGRPNKGGRMVTTNIKVSKETHEQIQEISNLLNKTQSEVISLGLRLLMPNLEEEKKRRKLLEESIEERVRNSQN
jgi:RNase H-fold protein (predicted Holliday junction resolvase)